jgi:hypothetical protein
MGSTQFKTLAKCSSFGTFSACTDGCLAFSHITPFPYARTAPFLRAEAPQPQHSCRPWLARTTTSPDLQTLQRWRHTTSCMKCDLTEALLRRHRDFSETSATTLCVAWARTQHTTHPATAQPLQGAALGSLHHRKPNTRREGGRAGRGSAPLIQSR